MDKIKKISKFIKIKIKYYKIKINITLKINKIIN